MAAQEKIFIFWSKSSGEYSSLRSMLQRDGWTIFIATTGASLSKFISSQDDNQTKRLACLAILNPIERLSSTDITSIGQFISTGHTAIIANSASDQESLKVNNLNALMALFGVKFNQDCVIRPNPYELYHPSDALLEDFIVNRGLEDSLKKYGDKKTRKKTGLAAASDDFLIKSTVNDRAIQDGSSIGSASVVAGAGAAAGLRIIYSKGCTLSVTSKSAHIMMTSSKWTIPSHKPVCAFYRDGTRNESRLIALGSAALLSDKFIDKEDNRLLVCGLMEFITKDDYYINMSDARTIEIAKNNMTADMDKLISGPICCLQKLEPLPDDKSKLIDRRLFSIDTSKLPQVIRAYTDLATSNESLTLMRPTIDWNLKTTTSSTSSSPKEQTRVLIKYTDGKMKLM